MMLWSAKDWSSGPGPDLSVTRCYIPAIKGCARSLLIFDDSLMTD